MSSTEENIFDFDKLPQSLDAENQDSVRLQVYLSHAGISSRRAAEEIIAQGRVTVDGKVVKERGFRVAKEAQVNLDGKPIYLVKNKIYLALNKPEYYVCSNSDPEGRELAVDLLNSYKDLRLFSVGRLDYLSSGLILFTNDGEFANKISHPRNTIEKEYQVDCKKDIPDDFLEAFKKGIYVKGERYKIISYKRIAPRKVKLILQEGKNREIRNAFAAFRLTINSLMRVRIGPVFLGDLKKGAYRVLKSDELAGLLAAGERKAHGNRH